MWQKGSSKLVIAVLQEVQRLVSLRLDFLGNAVDLERFKLQRLMLHLKEAIKAAQEIVDDVEKENR